jgi:ABC-type bacteriocin/lantibiotic exporter with double-glycine peptidase domain
LVLLDEATSSVDASTEAEIYDRLTTAFAGACIVSSVTACTCSRGSTPSS